MVTKHSLNGLKVLVTRPEEQAHQLCQFINLAGGVAIAFPVLDIVPILPWNSAGISLAEQDMIIFISRNAVVHFMAGLHTMSTDNVLLVAVGAGTAASMREHGLEVNIQPSAPAGSERLLAMPELKAVQDKKVLIVRGEGGRELLADTLQARGAKINYIDVYRRSLPILPKQQIELAKTADCIVITSIAGLDNLCRLINIAELKSKKLVVISERIRHYALTLGFQRCLVAEDASDAAVMQQVNRMEQHDGKK